MEFKYCSFGFILISVTLVLFTACNQNGATRPVMCATVMKFKQPEYKDYILANHFEGEDFISAMRFNRYERPVGKAGDSPYWELSNDWLLVDWKWGTFPYNAGLTLLTELTWDQFEVDSTNISHIPRWSLSEPHLMYPVRKIYYISLVNLKGYSGALYDVQLIEYLWGAPDSILIKDTTYDYENNHIEIMDSIWTILQRDLSVENENGDL